MRQQFNSITIKKCPHDVKQVRRLHVVVLLQKNMSKFLNFKSSLVKLSLVRRCAILEMKYGENRFNPDFIKHLNDALDEVETENDVDALVTIGSGKFFSNGIDLPFVLDSNRENVSLFMHQYSKLIARLLTFPLPTAAALNGKRIYLYRD